MCVAVNVTMRNKNFYRRPDGEVVGCVACAQTESHGRKSARQPVSHEEQNGREENDVGSSGRGKNNGKYHANSGRSKSKSVESYRIILYNFLVRRRQGPRNEYITKYL